MNSLSQRSAGRHRIGYTFTFGLAVLAAVSLVATGSSLPQPTAQAAGGAVRLNKVVERFQAGKPAFGIFSQNHSIRSAQTLARTDLDFLLIDMEHTPFDVETLQTFLLGLTDKQAILSKGNLQPNVVPFVRVPQYGDENLSHMIKQVLDVGVFGIMFPHTNTAAQALAAVQWARYPQRKGAADFQPVGHRGNAPTNAVWYWGLPGREYADRADVWPLDPQGELLLSFQIESPEAVKNIDAIADVPGVGAIFVGPNDLSFNLGNAGNANTPEEEAAIQTVVKTCLRKNIPCGITAYSPELVTRRLREGFRFLAIGQEIGLTPEIDSTLKAGRAFKQ